MAKGAVPQRAVLVRTLPDGAIEVTDAGDGSFVTRVTTKHALDAFVTMHRLRVVSTPAKKEQADG